MGHFPLNFFKCCYYAYQCCVKIINCFRRLRPRPHKCRAWPLHTSYLKRISRYSRETKCRYYMLLMNLTFSPIHQFITSIISILKRSIHELDMSDCLNEDFNSSKLCIPLSCSDKAIDPTSRYYHAFMILLWLSTGPEREASFFSKASPREKCHC